MLEALDIVRQLLPYNLDLQSVDAVESNPFVQRKCALQIHIINSFKVRGAASGQERAALCSRRARVPLLRGAFDWRAARAAQSAQLVGKLGGLIGTSVLPGSTIVLDRATGERNRP